MTPPVYRPDIDGLRAIAVLAVVAFHAQLGSPGGYVGVDVFFVISGFLITTLIVKDLEAGVFSLANFWERRIRRIWPAAMLVTLAVIAAGWLVMLPPSFERLAADARAQLLLYANIQFLHTTDYFDGSADLRPLLHTWSLAVEEQFYVFFPPILMLAWRGGRQRATLVVSLIAAASLGVSVWTLALTPKFAFYMLPARAWELALGSLLALLPLPSPRSSLRRLGWSALGLGLVITPMFLYGAGTPFPGLAALPPCMGTALLIHCGRTEGGVVRRILGCAPLRIVGLMSYSLYLWHWPILAFLRYIFGSDLSIPLRWEAAGLSFILAIVSWRMVETPVRRVGGRIGLAWIAGVAGVITLIGLAVSISISTSGGVPRRFTPVELALGVPEKVNTAWGSGGYLDKPHKYTDIFKPMGVEAPLDEPPDFLLWGDSHAMAISGMLDAAARAGSLSGYACLRNGTPAVPGVWIPVSGARARQANIEWNNSIIAWIRRNKPRNVVLCCRWSCYLRGRPEGGRGTHIAKLGGEADDPASAAAALLEGLNTVAAECRGINAALWVLTEVPYQTLAPERRMAMHHLGNDDAGLMVLGVGRAEHEVFQHDVVQVLRSLPPSVHVIDLAEGCFDVHGVSRTGGPWSPGTQVGIDAVDPSIDPRPLASFYADSNHLAPPGARVMTDRTLRRLVGLMASPAQGDAR